MPGMWGISPRQSVEAECQKRGLAAVVAGCVDLLDGRDADDALVVALGGPGAELVLSGREGGKSGYWPRVWAARGLLYAWADGPRPALARATTDDSWRVREMAAKGIAPHQVAHALTAGAGLMNDPGPPARAAAGRAGMGLSAARACPR